ncbi:MAG: hypothetical protein ACRDFB_01815, partial [Rhabdochlamydiaceae bacterium]
MQSRWYSIKDKAISLRKEGFSIKQVESKLGIPRSTLSSWFQDIELTKKQRTQLLLNWKNGLKAAQKKGGQWHHEQGQHRRENIRKEVESFASNVTMDKITGELILATFYLSEGTKRENCFRVANSNPIILQGIINLFRKIYPVEES